MNTDTQPHVFISYSRKDTAFVERLERDLNARGIVTWRDVHSIPGGAAWFRRIQAGLQASYAMLYIDTPHAAESEWVEQEFLFAIALRLPIIPVKLDERYLSFTTIRLNPIICDEARYARGLVRILAELDTLARQPIVPGAQPPAPRQAVESAPPLDDGAVGDYLSWVLINAQADLRDALYVELEATPERPSPLRRAEKSPLAFGLGDDDFDFSAVGLEHLPRDDFAHAGDEVADPRAAMRDLRRSVLLGDPGAGKTTTLLKLTVELARAAQAEPAAKLPVFVPLRQFNGETDFATFVQRQTYTLQDLYPTLSASGRLFLLCDALNEMPRRGKDDGRDLVAEVRDYLRGQPDWVVSCRVRDYTDDLNSIDGIGKIRLKPLDPPRIHDFIRRKYEGWGQAAVGAALWRDLRGSDLLLSFWQKVSEKGEGERFWDASAGVPSHTSVDEDSAWRDLHADHRRLLALCRSPFLANMICVLYRELHRRGESLPDNRAGLYAGFVGNLLRAEARRCEEVGLTWPGDAPIRAGMGQIAWALGAQTEMERGAAEALLRAHVPAHEPAAVLSAAAAAGIIDYGTDVRFTHQLLQQYFAAAVLGRQMDEGSDPADIWQPSNWWLSTGREETAILLAGDRNDPQGVARWLAPAQPEFALELLTQPDFRLDLDRLEAATRSTLIDAGQAKTAEPHPAGRAAAYRVLGRLNADDRRGIGVNADGIPDIVWCEIPAGVFQIGGDPDAWNAWKGMQIDLRYTYWMAQYPVTVAQFEAFVASDGYSTPDYWTEAGLRWKGDRTQPYDWNNPHWQISNHPVIGVTWYEAYAFTCWLDALYRQHDLYKTLLGLPYAMSDLSTDPDPFEELQSTVHSPQSLTIRLPTEAEWEKAARYPDGRKFPWGNDYIGGYATVYETTGVGGISAVGMYLSGRNPVTGIFDQIGNVWEWCMSEWRQTYHYPENNDPEGNTRRVVRGGSYFDSESVARAASRDRSYPKEGFSKPVSGFRIVASIPIR